jgi:heat shock protein HslJ
MWRGRPQGSDGEVVAFVAETVCSDGMSDARHPATVRLSLPDGRFFAGCCRIAPVESAGRGIEGRRWRLAAVQDIEADLRAARAPATARFSDGRTEGFGGCKHCTGAYTFDGDRLTSRLARCDDDGLAAGDDGARDSGDARARGNVAG